MRRLLVLLGRVALFVFLALCVLELALQAASLVVSGRGGGPGKAAHRIVCVGDSHTHGALVRFDQTYPAHLQRLLDEQAPGEWSVANLGIPGMSTTQVRHRLRETLAAHRPELVVVWCGVNNAWNRREVADDPEGGPTLDGLLAHLRVYRLYLVWRHDHRLARAIAPDVLQHDRFEIVRDPRDPEMKFTLIMKGRSEHIEYSGSDFQVDAEMGRRAEEDYRAMIAEARAAGAEPVFIAYPVDADAFAMANDALRRVAADTGVTLIESGRSALRVPEADRKLLWAAHPNGPIYAEVARDVVPVALAIGDGTAKERLGRIAFDAEAEAGHVARVRPVETTGPCAPTTAECPERCYLWNPERAICNLRRGLVAPAYAVRASLRLRVDAFPSGAGGTDVFDVVDDVSASGAYLQFTDRDRLELMVLGKPPRRCGPLATRLEPGTWYRIRLRAGKSADAHLALELASDDGRLLDAADCPDLPAGGGTFTQMTIGNANPAGSTAAIRIAEAEVVRDLP